MPAGERRNWSPEEVTLALALYLRTPRNKIRTDNPEIIELAKAIGRTPGAVNMKLFNLANHDKALRDKNVVSLAHGSRVDEQIWNLYLGEDRTRPLDALLDAVERIAASMHASLEGTGIQVIPAGLSTEGMAVVRTRRNQSFFRDAVMSMYNRRCLVTGLALSPLIEVAHIVPWSENASLRLVTANGLTLNPLIHRAYDANFLGIDPEMNVHVSPELLEGTQGDLHQLFVNAHGKRLLLPDNAQPSPEYLDHHFQGFKKHELKTGLSLPGMLA